MPFIPKLTTKLGIRPSIRTMFNMEKLTGTQKVQLAGARIWGNSIGGNMRNGSRKIRQNLQGRKLVDQYEIPVWNPALVFPYYDDPDIAEYEQEMDDRRKMRIMMRGVKIGKQKGGGKISIMSIYEKKKDAMV